MSALRLYWWSPRRSLRRLAPEIKHNSVAWAHLARLTGRPLKNFGDELSPAILEAVTGRSVNWSPAPRADVVAIGSIFELASQRPTRAAVWGTGIRGPFSEKEADRLRAQVGPILAVRGPLSRSGLGLPSSTPVGDPGLLSPLLVTRQPQPTDETIVIPHFSAWNTVEGRSRLSNLEDSGLSIVPPALAPLEVLRRIARARFVVSSSLHGVIVAHSLGVPTQLLINTSTSNPEPLFKYEDYFSSLGSEINHASYEHVADKHRREELFQEREAQAPYFESRSADLAATLTRAIQSHV